MTGGWTNISTSTIAIAIAAAVAREIVRKAKLQGCHSLGKGFTSSRCDQKGPAHSDAWEKEGRGSCFSPPGRDGSAWEKGQAIFYPDAHNKFTPAARRLSVTGDAWASDNGKTRNGRRSIPDACRGPTQTRGSARIDATPSLPAAFRSMQARALFSGHCRLAQLPPRIGSAKCCILWPTRS